MFYAAFSLLLYLLGKEISWSVSKSGLFGWVVFNQPAWGGVAGQYWFLFALIYDYILYAIIARCRLVKWAYWLAGAMFVLYVVMAQGCHLAGISVPNFIYRNWLVEGFAYFMLGHWIHHYQGRLRLKNSWLVAIIAVTTVLCLAERYVMGRDFGVNIVTIPQVFCLFLYAVNNPLRHAGLLQLIGQRYSMFVYILHPAVWHGLEGVYSRLGISENMAALYAMPVAVVLLTLGASHLVYVIQQKRKISKIDEKTVNAVE